MTIATDGAAVTDAEQVLPVVNDGDRSWKVNIVARVDKYDRAAIAKAREFFSLPDDVEPIGWQLAAVAAPYETIIAEDNGLTRQGRKRLIDRLAGTASNQALDATHLRIGTGDDSTAYADTQTDLVAAAGATHRQFQLATGGITVGSGASSGVATIVATFGTGVGNYTLGWQEWGVDGGTADGTTVTSEGNTTPGLINRKVTNLGVKTSAASWVFTVTITIT